MMFVLLSLFLASAASDQPGGGLIQDCTYDRCTPICSLRYPENCPENTNPCNCPKGALVSERGGICIQREKCPIPILCPGPNEGRNSCPPPCLNEYCSERNKVVDLRTCRIPKNFCRPQCVCDKGFYRNGSDICVPADECPDN